MVKFVKNKMLCIMRGTMKKNKRNMGIIIILVGVGILFISIFFSSGYHSKRDFIGNMYRMEIVLDLGKWERFGSNKKRANKRRRAVC